LGCFLPQAQAGQLARMQGLRTRAREPLRAGQQAWNFFQRCG
jgi:hypothetical protein